MHISALRATSYKIHLRDTSNFSFKCRLDTYLWTNLFNGQISISKTPQHPHFTFVYASSRQFISCFSQPAVMTLQKEAARLSPFPPLLGQKFYNALFRSHTSASELSPCRSESSLHPRQAGSVQGGRYTQRSAWLRRFPGVYWHDLTQTQVSHKQPPFHNRALPPHNTKHQRSQQPKALLPARQGPADRVTGLKAAFTKE